MLIAECNERENSPHFIKRPVNALRVWQRQLSFLFCFSVLSRAVQIQLIIGMSVTDGVMSICNCIQWRLSHSPKRKN